MQSAPVLARSGKTSSAPAGGQVRLMIVKPARGDLGAYLNSTGLAYERGACGLQWESHLGRQAD